MVGCGDAAGCRKNETEGVLGHGNGVASGSEHYGDATFGGDPDVDAGGWLVTAASNDLQVFSRRQDGLIYLLELQHQPFDEADSTA
jgi:hypothetical protein